MTLEGFQDFGPAQLALLARLRRDAGALFADAGYVEVAPPILEPAESYVERSGEDIRARTYVFDDPGGEEVCLRPELTIPVCRLALRAGYAAKKIARLHYWGSVFRYEPLSAGRYRQFHQVGAELIGPVPEKDGDIEIAALAIELARRAGSRISRCASAIAAWSARCSTPSVSTKRRASRFWRVTAATQNRRTRRPRASRPP